MRDSVFKKVLVNIYESAYKQKTKISELLRRIELRTGYRLNIMSYKQTFKYIYNNKCSIARFGDGEFRILLKTGNPGFQSISDDLSAKLDQVLQSTNPKLLICVPSVLNSVKGCKKEAADFWIDWGRSNDHHKRVVRLLRFRTSKNYKFGDTQLTRPYMDWKDSTRAKKTFAAFKELWNDRNILIVEGEQTRLGVENDLFSNAKSIKRIIAPAEDAFSRYNDILNAVKRNHRDELVLLALGPTATVLAADLANDSCQAIDIGHIDIEYEWYLSGATKKTAVKGKYVNELPDGRETGVCMNEQYLRQILEQIV